VSDVDPRLVAALRTQLSRRPADAPRVGWKYGSGDDERIGDEIAVGHLTAIAGGSTYRGGGRELHADAEVAVEIGAGGAIGGYGAALEIVDLGRHGTPEVVVANNDFHCAVAFGPFADELPSGLEGVLVVNGERRDAALAPTDVEERVAAVARVLGAVGEGLREGDRVITGLIVQGPVAPGDEVAAELGELGSVALRIA
jgi:hypothetical protein